MIVDPILVSRQDMADAIVYHYGQNGRGQCSAGCDVRLGSSLAAHAIDMALAGDPIPEKFK